jgi:hypothetical protein
VRVALPFQLVLAGAATTSDDALLDLPIPFDPVLSGNRIWVQGGGADPQGALLGTASLSQALEVTLGG